MLVRMKGRPKERHNNWLLIKERDEEVREGGMPLIDEAVTSVTTGRSMDEIAGEHDRVWHSNKPADEQDEAALSPPPNLSHQGGGTRNKALLLDGDGLGGGDGRGKTALPAFIPPQLAKRVAHPPSAKGWLHEIKFGRLSRARPHCRWRGYSADPPRP